MKARALLIEALVGDCIGDSGKQVRFAGWQSIPY